MGVAAEDEALVDCDSEPTAEVSTAATDLDANSEEAVVRRSGRERRRPRRGDEISS